MCFIQFFLKIYLPFHIFFIHLSFVILILRLIKLFSFIFVDYKVLCLGLIQSLFEGSMYVFVLEWTPALTPPAPQYKTRDLDSEDSAPTIPHGHIFAGFMVNMVICLQVLWSIWLYFCRIYG
jgi:hypothetical protein